MADGPFGSEITAALLAILAALLGLIYRSIHRSFSAGEGQPREARADDIANALAESERKSSAALTTLTNETMTRIDQHDRHIAQLVESVSENLNRRLREKEFDDQRAFERMGDKIDRLRGD